MTSLVITFALLSVLVPALLLWWRSFVKLRHQTARLADDLAWLRVQREHQAKALQELFNNNVSRAGDK